MLSCGWVRVPACGCRNGASPPLREFGGGSMRSLGWTGRGSKILQEIQGRDRSMRMLFSFSDRDAAHQKLEEVRRAEGPNSQAECRENPNDHEPYQVWSAPSGLAR